MSKINLKVKILSKYSLVTTLVGIFSTNLLAAEISFEEVIKNFRQKHSFDTIHKNIDMQRDESFSSETRRLSDAPELAVRGEMASKDSSDQKYEFLLKQKINFGIDKDLIQKKNDAEFRVEKLSKTKEFLEAEHEVAKIFSELKLTQSLVQYAKKTLDIIGPYEGKASMAASGGSLGGFFLARFQIFLQNVKNDHKLLTEKYQQLAIIFSDVSGLPIPSDPAQVSFKSLDSKITGALPKDENYLPLQESLAKEQSLASEISRLSSHRQIEVGAGMVVEKESQKNSYLVELGIPLGLSLVNASQTKSLDYARKVNSSGTDLKRLLAKQQIAMLKANQSFASKSYLSSIQKVQSTEHLFEKAQKSFYKGNAEIAEYIETLRELHESKAKQAELLRDYEDASFQLYYFAPEGI